MKLERLQHEVLELCFGPEPSAQQLVRLGSQPERWLLYRDMLRGRVAEMVELALPRTARLLGAAAFREAVHAWLSASPPASPYIRDVAAAFVAFSRANGALPRGRQSDDLIGWELAIWLAVSDPASPGEVAPFSFELPLALNPTLRLLEVTHRVQHGDSTEPPEIAPTTLAVFRHPESHRAMWIELSDFGARLLRSATASHVSATALCRALAEQTETALDQTFVENVAAALGVWLDEGLLRGSRASSAPSVP